MGVCWEFVSVEVWIITRQYPGLSSFCGGWDTWKVICFAERLW